jgi:hypothetical protein
VSVDWTTRQDAMRAWVAGGCQLPLSNVYWGGQDSERPPEPAVELRVYSSHPMGMAWLDTEVQFNSFSPINVTAVNVGQSRLTATAHGLGNGDGPVRVTSTGTVPGGLVLNTDYWVIKIDANTIQLAKSFVNTGGAWVNGVSTVNPVTPITLTSAGTGTISVQSTGSTQRAGHEIRQVSRSLERLGLMVACYTSEVVGINAAMSLLDRIKARQKLPSQQAILRAAHLGLTLVERSRAIHGVRNAVQFEPRALVEVLFSMPTEEAEDGTIIGAVSGTNAITGKTFKVP